MRKIIGDLVAFTPLSFALMWMLTGSWEIALYVISAVLLSFDIIGWLIWFMVLGLDIAYKGETKETT